MESEGHADRQNLSCLHGGPMAARVLVSLVVWVRESSKACD